MHSDVSSASAPLAPVIQHVVEAARVLDNAADQQPLPSASKLASGLAADPQRSLLKRLDALALDGYNVF